MRFDFLNNQKYLDADITASKAVDFAQRSYYYILDFGNVFCDDDIILDEIEAKAFANKLFEFQKSIKQGIDFATNIQDINLLHLFVDLKPIVLAVGVAIDKSYKIDDDNKYIGNIILYFRSIYITISKLLKYHPDLEPRQEIYLSLRYPKVSRFMDDLERKRNKLKNDLDTFAKQDEDIFQGEKLPDDNLIHIPAELSNHRDKLQSAMDAGLLIFIKNRAKWLNSDRLLGFFLGILICDDCIGIKDNKPYWVITKKGSQIKSYIWQWFGREKTDARSKKAKNGVQELPDGKDLIIGNIFHYKIDKIQIRQ